MKFEKVFILEEGLKVADQTIEKGELAKTKLPKELNIYFAYDSHPRKIYGKATNFVYKDGAIYCDADIPLIDKLVKNNTPRLALSAEFRADPQPNLKNIQLKSLVLTFTPLSKRSFLW